jgi:predicted MFS family arabinose efflux permease
MPKLFRERTSKFGSLVCLVAVTAMLALFSLALPDFLVSAAGRVFAGAWTAVAVLLLVVHARRVVGERRRRPVTLVRMVEGRPRKEASRSVRVLRG